MQLQQRCRFLRPSLRCCRHQLLAGTSLVVAPAMPRVMCLYNSNIACRLRSEAAWGCLLSLGIAWHAQRYVKLKLLAACWFTICCERRLTIVLIHQVMLTHLSLGRCLRHTCEHIRDRGCSTYMVIEHTSETLEKTRSCPTVPCRRNRIPCFFRTYLGSVVHQHGKDKQLSLIHI